jgi:preprotein translocase subunit SecG
MLYTFITVIHIIVCFFLAIVVLLQQGKGSDVSAVFGGSSQTLFGSSGAGNLLTKLTSASAAIFMITSLTLTYGAAKQNTKSLFDNAPVKTPPPAATTGDAPAAQSGTATDPQSPVTPAKTENVAQPANVITEEQKAQAVSAPQSSSATGEPQGATVSAPSQAQSATQPTAAASGIKTEEPKAAEVPPSAPTAPVKPEPAATPHHPKLPTPAKKKN